MSIPESRRSLRRHHRARLQKSRSHYWGMKRYAIFFGEPTPEQLGTVVDTPTPCSCSMCGNPRRYTKEESFNEKKRLLELTIDL